jgi:hypothetical protein
LNSTIKRLCSTFRATLTFSIVIRLVCRFVIATIQLLQQFAPLHLVHPLANPAWTTPDPPATLTSRAARNQFWPDRCELFPKNECAEFFERSLGTYLAGYCAQPYTSSSILLVPMSAAAACHFDSGPSFTLSQFPLDMQVLCQLLNY